MRYLLPRFSTVMTESDMTAGRGRRSEIRDQRSEIRGTTGPRDNRPRTSDVRGQAKERPQTTGQRTAGLPDQKAEERPTSNVQRPTSNIQRRMSTVWWSRGLVVPLPLSDLPSSICVYCVHLRLKTPFGGGADQSR